ncbi:(deoxy)nucleoside triphosphate pyrophosphohydrolase, partial [Turicimonas muris]
WEFPGGKMEKGESPEAAIVREIREELEVEIEPEKLITTVEYDYPNFHLTMHCFLSRIVSGEIVLTEHEAAKWLDKRELDTVDWLPADVEVVTELKKVFGV